MMMTLETLHRLLELRGSDLGRWPVQERDAALTLVNEDVAASKLLREHQRLDELLNLQPVEDFAPLKIAVRNQALPPRQDSAFDRVINWLVPQPGAFVKQLWRPSLAASLPLVFGLLLGNVFSFGISSVTAQEVEYWDDELSLLSLIDYSGEEL